MNNSLETLIDLIRIGFVLGVTLAVIVAAARVGWILAPYLFLAAILVWFFAN